MDTLLSNLELTHAQTPTPGLPPLEEDTSHGGQGSTIRQEVPSQGTTILPGAARSTAASRLTVHQAVLAKREQRLLQLEESEALLLSRTPLHP